jgi:hypothetical protein
MLLDPYLSFVVMPVITEAAERGCRGKLLTEQVCWEKKYLLTPLYLQAYE